MWLFRSTLLKCSPAVKPSTLNFNPPLPYSAPHFSFPAVLLGSAIWGRRRNVQAWRRQRICSFLFVFLSVLIILAMLPDPGSEAIHSEGSRWSHFEILLTLSEPASWCSLADITHWQSPFLRGLGSSPLHPISELRDTNRQDNQALLCPQRPKSHFWGPLLQASKF